MGGGHVSRPDFGMPQTDPNHPLTEFYLALQHALDKEGSFALPALYAGFQAPARRIYADEAAEYLTLSSTAGEGMTRLLAPGHLQLLYSSLHVMPDGAPAALLLTEECTRTVVAVQLLPPFVWEDPLPPCSPHNNGGKWRCGNFRAESARRPARCHPQRHPGQAGSRPARCLSGGQRGSGRGSG